MTTTTALPATSLYCREGTSDKEYHVRLVPEGGGFAVHFAYGRRGVTLATGTKTSATVPFADAQRLHDKLVREKKAKGYTEGANGAAYQPASQNGRITGLRPSFSTPWTKPRSPGL